MKRHVLLSVACALVVSVGCEKREDARRQSGGEAVAGGESEPRSNASTPTTSPPATASPPNATAGVPDMPPLPDDFIPNVQESAQLADSDNVLDAPAEWEGIVPRVTLQSAVRYGDLIHEANNKVMRGEVDEYGAYKDSASRIRGRWFQYAKGTRGLFVLRDSLFSQPEHPFLQESFWPMLPPNWVTTAAARVEAGLDFKGPATYPIEDDAAWTGKSIEQIFGDFPQSESLHEQATADLDTIEDPGERAAARTRARRARKTLHHLAKDVNAMHDMYMFGAKSVAKVGASRIAYGDRAYFGEKIRRERIIPIFVENPDVWEIEEGKGMRVPGMGVPQEVVTMVTHEVCRARLKDGDLALERYDLSSVDDRQRAIALLEALFPPGDKKTSGKVWLWVTGDLIEGKKLQGEGPLEHMPVFLKELEAANIDRARLELFGKPTIFIRGDAEARRAALKKARDEHKAAGLNYVSVTLTSPALRNILE